MEVDFSFLCDYADNPGKLYALGIGIDTIYTAAVPTVHPVMYAVARLRFSGVEAGDKPIGVRLLDADGNNLVPPIDANVTVESPPQGHTERTLTIALALHGVRFERYGLYAVVWMLQGNEIKRIPFRVSTPPTTA